MFLVSYSLSCEMTCDDCMVADGSSGWCAKSDGLCWYDSTQGKCLRDSMVWQDGACVGCVGLDGVCSRDSVCCGFDTGSSYCESALYPDDPDIGRCTGTDDPCSPIWSDPESIDQGAMTVCCGDEPVGTDLLWDIEKTLTVYD